jgi:serine/threonine-protein kinase RsbW
MHLDLALNLPKDAETVALVRAAIASTLTLFGVSDSCVEDIRLAVSEACSNVVSHAERDDGYEVDVHVDELECAIDIRNIGYGFDAAALDGVMPDPMSPRGRGVAIMKTVMDSVNMTSSPEAGTLVHLTRTLTMRDDGPLGRLRPRSGS